MIAYLDTSAIIPLIVLEQSTDSCRLVWESADDLVTSQLTYVEAAAALAHARRLGRLDRTGHRQGVAALDGLWSSMTTVPVTEDLIAEAAQLAADHALRGYDAVHCAAAVRVADGDHLVVSGDRRLLDAWADLGFATVDVNH